MGNLRISIFPNDFLNGSFLFGNTPKLMKRNWKSVVAINFVMSNADGK
ncbi:16454_t:CDS:2 [Racocetra persica]|uniref:16454_t:CDS:1 n=1 Tax=Racocetra persica TaxID=160502 RepID=A0ACA9K7S0_9GLOM|nr:16454_t:CDS:2 [Racocetra persica]